MPVRRTYLAITAALAGLVLLAACKQPTDIALPQDGIAGHEEALESVLRAIPVAYIDAARTSLHVAYQHTSHGTHVSYGLYGLQDYKAGDAARFGLTTDASPADPAKLDFHDYAIAPNEYCDLSTSDNGGWDTWLARNRTYLDDLANAGINVVMWSWCSITNHNVANYLASMETLIGEYGAGGSKIGTGAGKTRTTSVTFIFMTGHAEGSSNVGAGMPRDQAKLITDYCLAKGYYCIDYYSIDTHDMAGVYHEDADDNGYSPGLDLRYFTDWQTAHTLGSDWYYNKSSPGGAVAPGNHNEGSVDLGIPDNHITANRKAYAMWYILARVAGWDGNP